MPKRGEVEQPAQLQRSGPDWWGRGLALVALLIAALSLLVAHGQWRDARAEKARRLEVSLFFVAPVAKGIQYPRGLNFRVVNPGYQVVTVAAAGLFRPDGSRLWFGRGTGDWQFPQRIPPAENVGIHFAGQDLADLCRDLGIPGLNGTVALIGFCEDGEGKVHRSAPLQFNTQDALKLAGAQIEDTAAAATGGHSESQ